MLAWTFEHEDYDLATDMVGSGPPEPEGESFWCWILFLVRSAAARARRWFMESAVN